MLSMEEHGDHPHSELGLSFAREKNNEAKTKLKANVIAFPWAGIRSICFIPLWL